MTSAEFAEWLAFNRVEPLPDLWLQTGIVASTTFNMLRTKGKPRSPEDFIPKVRPPKRRMTMREMMANMTLSAPMELQ